MERSQKGEQKKKTEKKQAQKSKKGVSSKLATVTVIHNVAQGLACTAVGEFTERILLKCRYESCAANMNIQCTKSCRLLSCMICSTYTAQKDPKVHKPTGK